MNATLAQRIATRLGSLAPHDAASLHRLRRAFAKELASETPELIIAAALMLVEEFRVPGSKMIERGEARAHGQRLGELGGRRYVCCLLAGRAWRAGVISDDVVRSWARSQDRFWRRAALVATVPLNVRSQGGRGDRRRSLAICRMLIRDRDRGCTQICHVFR